MPIDHRRCVRSYLECGELRFIFNALKYCTSIAVVALSSFSAHHLLWLVVAVVSTMYAFAWDVRMDWGLRLRRTGLDPIIVPSGAARRYSTRFYACAACANAVARLGWAIYISPQQQIVQQHMTLLLGCVELLRRAQAQPSLPH